MSYLTDHTITILIIHMANSTHYQTQCAQESNSILLPQLIATLKTYPCTDAITGQDKLFFSDKRWNHDWDKGDNSTNWVAGSTVATAILYCGLGHPIRHLNPNSLLWMLAHHPSSHSTRLYTRWPKISAHLKKNCLKRPEIQSAASYKLAMTC